MNTDNYACAKIIDTQFKRLRQLYKILINHINNMDHLIIAESDLNMWLKGENSDSPVLLINTFFYSWNNADLNFVDRRFEREIENNLMRSDVGYFEYIDNIFAKHWNFIKQFNESIKFYINSDDNATIYINKLYDPPAKFSKHELKNSIELQLIYIFDIWENLYKKFDKAYNLYFKEAEFLRKHQTNPNYIMLGYGENNEKAIGLIHRTLESNGFISCDFDTFFSHFDPYALPIPKPINWLGNDMQLLVLFLGKKLQLNPDGPWVDYQLKLNKQLNCELILEHFNVLSNTTARKLSINYANAHKRPTFYGSKHIVRLIDDLKYI